MTIYRQLGFPGYPRFLKLLEGNYFVNCTLTSDDAKWAIHIYGPDIASLQGKTTRRHPTALLHTNNTYPLPPVIQDLHPNVTIYYMIINGLHFLHTIGLPYRMLTAENNSSTRKPNHHKIYDACHNVVAIYQARGLHVSCFMADNQFECITNQMLPVQMNICSAREHVPAMQ